MESELTVQNIGRLYRKYLIPSVGGALATSVYSFVDTIAVGQACGPEGAAAIAVINPYFAVMCFIGLLFGIGGSVLMGHAKGEGRLDRANCIFSASLFLLCGVMVVSWILSALFLDEILIFCGADEALLPYARSYIIPIVCSFPLFAINTFLAPMIRYDERPKLVLKAVLIGGCFNIFGDWFLVFPMNLDMFGAGLATAIGALIQTLALLSHFIFRHSSLKVAWSRKLLCESKRIFSTGFGASILDVAIGALTIVINRQTMKYGGRDELAVLGVIMTISFLLQHLYAGAGQAVQPIASTNYGAGLKKRTWNSFSYLMWTSIAFGVLSSIFCIAFPEAILTLFMDTSDRVMEIGPYIVRVYSLSFLLMAVNINIVFFLQSILLPFPALVFSLSRGVVISGVLLFVLPLFMSFGGILWAMVLAEVVTFVFALPYTLIVRKQQLASSELDT